MAAIERRGIAKLSEAVAFGSGGTTLFTADGNYLLSVIAANTKSTDGVVFVYVVPDGASEDEYGIMAYSLPVSGFNSYETFRFGVNPTDVVKVAGSEGIAFYIQGIDQVATV
jgi:hypothetical protein